MHFYLEILCLVSLVSTQQLFYEVASCQTDYQSPINLQSELGSCQSQRMMNIQLSTVSIPLSLNILNILNYSLTNSHGQLYGTNSQLDLIGFDMTRVQLKSPSEHKYEDQSYDVELQLTFKQKSYFSQQQQQLAMVGVLFKVDEILNDEILDTSNPEDIRINLNRVNDINNHQFYYYKGSQTVPPCYAVEWFISKRIYFITKEQLQTISDKQGYSNRPLQSNKGEVVYGGSTCNTNFQEFLGFFILYIFIINTVLKLI